MTNSFPDEWITLNDVVLLIAYNEVLRTKIMDTLIDLHSKGQHPDWIKQTHVNRYKFNKKYLEAFCKEYGFDLAAPIKRHAVDYKSKNWLCTKELRQYLPGSESQILTILQKLQSQMPDAIKEKQNGPVVRLCLHKKYIDTVKSIINKETAKQIQNVDTNTIYANCFMEKTGPDEWISLTYVRNLILNGLEERDRLHDSLMALYNTQQYPNWIQRATKKQYMFNKKYLPEFCMMYSFEIKDTPDSNIKWLRIVDLQHLISKSCQDFSKTLTAALQDLHSRHIFSNWVCRPSESRYYLNEKYLIPFTKMYNFRLICQDTRTEEWLSAAEIWQQTKCIEFNKISRLLKKHQSDMPEWIQTKRKKQLPCLCLHRDHVSEFCKIAGIQLCKDTNAKTSEWFATSEYRLFLKDFDANTQTNALETAFTNIAKTHPDWIQYKTCKNGQERLCLHKNHVADFCTETGFICNNKKTEQWLDVRELGLMTHISPAKILVTLQNNQKANPEIIQIRRLSSRPVLCLHRDHVTKITEWMQNLDKKSIAMIIVKDSGYKLK